MGLATNSLLLNRGFVGLFMGGGTPLKGVPLSESIFVQKVTPFVKKKLQFSIRFQIGFLTSGNLA
jgi:hypothetical protein